MRSKKIKVTKKKMKHELFKAMAQQGYTIRGSKVSSPKIITKEDIRKLHYYQKKSRVIEDMNFFNEFGLNYIDTYFANGRDVNPETFDPELVPVSADDWTGRLFRLATLLWSVPVSKGYGRRMRFLVMDKSNKKLAGIIALGDPVFNLKVRDDFIGWNSNDRKERLFNVMDAYVLGAVPPYNQLLVGKFLAGLLSTNEIRQYFAEKYKDKTTIIQGKNKPAELVLITTTSALGRSSVYNRIFVDRNGQRDHLLRSIGYTAGFGHFHVPENVFNLMRVFLSERNEKYADAHQYGNGPNWRMRVIRKTMELLGYSKTPLLQHGIQREVFISPLAKNYKEYLRGEAIQPDYIDLTLKEYTLFFKKKYLVPRYHRRPDIINFNSQNVYTEICNLMSDEEDLEGMMTNVIYR
ncbi:Uncharacterised protein [Chlamydia abortus]|nr:Uncharacterised protein [Chlamydia abortus]